MSDELKACPFCGGDAVLIPSIAGSMTLWQAHCEWDGCGARSLKTNNEGLAIAAWNTRPEPAADDALVGALIDVRARNAGSFEREGKVWEAYDRAVLDCIAAVEALTRPPGEYERRLEEVKLRLDQAFEGGDTYFRARIISLRAYVEANLKGQP
jgi:Lar family restriction alleviation protein